ncbi:retrovirus-related pol polyprotein from transposon TNT 1-94, partial [Tanacetum coccineum]
NRFSSGGYQQQMNFHEHGVLERSVAGAEVLLAKLAQDGESAALIVFWLEIMEELLWFISGSTSAKLTLKVFCSTITIGTVISALACTPDVGSMWEGQNTSATCAMIRSKISQLLMMLRYGKRNCAEQIRVGCEDGLMEVNAREQAQEREWKQRIIDINSAIGVVRLSLAKNVSYNIVNEKTTFRLIKVLSNMYEKPSVANKVFLIRQLVNLKMKEGGSVTDHVNEFNSIISRLVSVDIKFEDEVQVLLLLSSLPDSWSGTVIAVSSSTGSAKLTFEEEEVQTEGMVVEENAKTRKRSQSKNRKDITCWICKEKGHFKNKYSKPLADKGKKEMNMAADSEDDALIYCVKNSTESCILDSGASCHASYSRDVMQNFKKYSGKVRLADKKCLDITRVGDVVFKNTLGTN